MNIRDTYFGFTDNMKSMQKVRIEKFLDSVKRYNGVIMSNKEFVYNEIQGGAKPKMVENYQYYKRNGELSKPKNDYRLCYTTMIHFGALKRLFMIMQFIF